MSLIVKDIITVGGLPVHIHRLSNSTWKTRPVAVLFLLHGRLGSAAENEPIAHSVLASVHKQNTSKDLYVVTLDHRNHGHRLVDATANNAWSAKPEQNNERHALDMYAIQTGTARDISFLIDFLPSYLFPMGETTITDWGVVGISLGGHSTWMALAQDARIRIGIPIIGCPDYLTLIGQRARRASLDAGPPYLPNDLLEFIKRSDPASTPYSALDSTNPFFGKNILVLSGGADKLVPWDASEEFVTKLEVGPRGRKVVRLYEGIGHKCTEEMVEEVAWFVREVML